MALPKILKSMLSLPTASFVEHAVMDFIQRECRRMPDVTTSYDRYGNLLARYRRQPRGANPVIFSAHTDHPGFVAQEMLDDRTLCAAFRGGVLSSYFDGAAVRFWSGGRCVNATVQEVTDSRTLQRGSETWEIPQEVTLRVGSDVAPNCPGMWALPEPAEHAGCVHARCCDDIAGCAAIMELLARLSRARASADVYCLFTRAEEVGFIGAIAAAKARTIPKNVPLIAIETSSELPNARIGDGPILRVGDRMSVFDPAATAFCGRVAQDLAKRRGKFHFQRKLMDGGSCESTAYATYGYRATGICLALGNYHNMDKQSRQIAPENVSISDWKMMVDWFEAIALDEVGFTQTGRSAGADFGESLRKWAKELTPMRQ